MSYICMDTDLQEYFPVNLIISYFSPNRTKLLRIIYSRGHDRSYMTYARKSALIVLSHGNVV